MEGIKDKAVMRAGLCEDCTQARWMKSEKGSVFIRCELALRDPRFEKYPRLPVIACAGYQKKAVK